MPQGLPGGALSPAVANLPSFFRKKGYNTRMLLLASAAEHFRIPLPPLVFFILFALLFAGWLIYTIVLRYHWKKYAHSKLDIMHMDIIYFIGSGALLVAMAISALFYSLTATAL